MNGWINHNTQMQCIKLKQVCGDTKEKKENALLKQGAMGGLLYVLRV